MSSLALEFLQIIKLKPEDPTIDFLVKLLKHHQRYIPYENISKLIESHKQNYILPSFEKYIKDIQTFDYGGTCFIQNVYFHRILQFLGFDSTLQGDWVDGKVTHPNIRVRLNHKNYFVDLGIMSSFVGPYLINPKHTVIERIGDQTYHLSGAEDLRSVHVQIYRKDKMIREIKSLEPTPTTDQLNLGFRDTFEKTELFMTSLVAHKVFDGFSLGIWNKGFYRDEGKTHVVTELKSYEDLLQAFKHLEMPKAQVQEALEVLSLNNVDLFSNN